MKNRIAHKVSLLLLSAAILTQLTGCGHEHSWSKWKVDKEATCTEDGLKIRICECGEEETKKIAADGHSKGEWIVDKDPTCTEDGKKHQICSVCEETIKEETIASTGGHDYDSEITEEATCQEEGEKTFTCSECGDTYTEAVTLQTYSSTELHEKFLNSVCEIVVYDRNGDELALGSGFVYTEDGQIVTNYHVIEDAYSAEVIINEKTYQVKYVLAYDKDIDIAVLKINKSGLEAVTLCTETHRVGEKVYAFGSSRGMTATFSDGMITYANREIDGVVYTQHDAPISGGNSGGPLINEYGEVIGINTWTVRDSQNLNFAINVSELDNLEFGERLTMAQFFEKECNAFVRLKNYIIQNGTYDASGGWYAITLGTSYSSDYTNEYTRRAYYYEEDDDITLDFLINEGEYWFYVVIDSELSGVYGWEYFDDYDVEVYGTMDAPSFDSEYILDYDSSNTNDDAVLYSSCQLASSMASVLLSYISEDLEAIGVTAADLSFNQF